MTSSCSSKHYLSSEMYLYILYDTNRPTEWPLYCTTSRHLWPEVADVQTLYPVPNNDARTSAITRVDLYMGHVAKASRLKSAYFQSSGQTDFRHRRRRQSRPLCVGEVYRWPPTQMEFVLLTATDDDDFQAASAIGHDVAQRSDVLGAMVWKGCRQLL